MRMKHELGSRRQFWRKPSNPDLVVSSLVAADIVTTPSEQNTPAECGLPGKI